jgi:hypothetical protein
MKCREPNDAGYIALLARIIGDRLILDSPSELSRIEAVEICGALYTIEGVVREIVRVAPVKFLEEHYKDVEELINNGMRPMKAYQTVAEKYDFDVDSFRKGYRKWFIRTQPT